MPTIEVKPIKVARVAEILGVSVKRGYSVVQHMLPAACKIKVGRAIYVNEIALLEWLANGGTRDEEAAVG